MRISGDTSRRMGALLDAMQTEQELRLTLDKLWAKATDAAFELAIGLFADSIHEKWTQDEVIRALETLRAVCAADSHSVTDNN